MLARAMVHLLGSTLTLCGSFPTVSPTSCLESSCTVCQDCKNVCVCVCVCVCVPTLPRVGRPAIDYKIVIRPWESGV